MKLKSFNQANAKQHRAGVPSVRLNAKSGTITFSSAFSDATGIKAGCHIEISQDEERPTDWYVHLSPNPDAFVVRQKDKVYSPITIQSTTLVRGVFTSLNESEESVSYRMSIIPLEVDGMKLYAIITKAKKA